MGLNIFPLALVAEVFIWNRVFSSGWQTEREIAAIFLYSCKNAGCMENSLFITILNTKLKNCEFYCRCQRGSFFSPGA